ncbi:hypothetical protein [Pseudomonas putida]|jgi:hypothetical protein|uniref:hypothetical protein n=1 Tax=Pseudomonas putida TaxID=303 RepID=UPI00383BCC7F
MTKGLPDPPARATTASSSFSTCECSHPPLFAVLKALELAKGTCRDLLLSNDHGLDSAKAVVEALLDGVEGQQLTVRGLRASPP